MNNRKYYIIITVIAILTIAAIIFTSFSELDTIKRESNSSERGSAKVCENEFVSVHIDTLRSLCKAHEPFNNDLKIGIRNDTLYCNIPVAGETNIFIPDHIHWKELGVYTDKNIALQAEVLSNGDTIVHCPAIMLCRLTENYEKPQPAQQDF